MLGASSALPCMMQAPAKKAGRPAGGGGGRKRGGREQLCKKYGQGFVWGQLNGWFKQTVRASVSDPVHDPPLDSADLLHLRSLVLMLIHSWKLPLNTLKSM